MAVNCSKVAHENSQTFLSSVPYVHFSVNSSFMPMDSSRGRLIMQGAKKLLISQETFNNIVLITCSFSYTVMRNVRIKTFYKFKLVQTFAHPLHITFTHNLQISADQCISNK